MRFSGPEGDAKQASKAKIAVGVEDAKASEAAKHVLVVVNTASNASMQIGSYYASKRAVPKSNVVRLLCSAEEACSKEEFEKKILAPVKKQVAAAKWRIDYIVTTKGVPIRSGGGNGYSVDSMLVGMNRKNKQLPEYLTQQTPNVQRLIEESKNPYLGARKHFDSNTFQMYLVCRLDAYTVGDAMKLVDNSLKASAQKGPILLDWSPKREGAGYKMMNDTLISAARVLQQKGFKYTLEKTETFVDSDQKLMGYASWGSNDSSYDERAYHRLRFAPGAIAETFVSTSARTFTPTTGGQSLIADLISQGVTGVKGYASEPYAWALCHVDVLFDHYTAGFNLAESFYSSSLLIKWKDVVIGDPLCSPYRRN
jgi:uncharacterized protein (TIGR03790 family)